MQFTSYDNETIWYRLWKAAKPRAVIQVMTGLAEVADYYEDFAQQMVKAGFTVALHEYRKHGRTVASYGNGNLFRNFARDGAQLCGLLRDSYPELPVVLLAHSLGTTVSQVAIFEKMARWDGIIYMGPSHAVLTPDRKESLLEAAEKDILLYGEDAVNAMIFRLVFGENQVLFTAFGYAIRQYLINMCIVTLLVMIWNFFTKRAILRGKLRFPKKKQGD